MQSALAALSKATRMTITIFQYREESKRYAPIMLKPGRLGTIRPFQNTTSMRYEDRGRAVDAGFEIRDRPGQ